MSLALHHDEGRVQVVGDHACRQAGTGEDQTDFPTWHHPPLTQPSWASA